MSETCDGVAPTRTPRWLRTQVVQASTTAATVTDLITRTVAAKGWLILCFHSIVASGATGQAALQVTFDTIIDAAAASRIDVATTSDVMRRV